MYEKSNYEIREIGDHVFSVEGIRELIEWVNFPPSIEVVGEGAFQDCINLWYYSWPGEETRVIKEYAFAGCKKLQHFVFPAFLQKLGGHAFEGCTSLGIIIFGRNIEEVPFAVCRGCTNLRTVVIFPGLFEKLKKVQDCAFDGCENLGLIFLPHTLEYIGEAFRGCKNLTNISSSMATPPRIAYETFENPERIRLEIPKGSLNTYLNTQYWNRFFNIVETEENWETEISLPKKNNAKTVESYSISGQKINDNQKGIKIIRDTNGKIKKVLSR